MRAADRRRRLRGAQTDLCIAVSTGGAAPALAANVRDRLAEQIGDEYGEAVSVLSRLRERLLESVDDASARRRATQGVLSAGLVELVRAGRQSDAAALCDAALETARAEVSASARPNQPGLRPDQRSLRPDQKSLRSDQKSLRPNRKGEPCTR